MYNRPAEIWAYDTQRGARKLRTFHEATGRLSAQLPLRLSYYGGGHYDSIVDAKHSDQLLLSVPGVAESLALSRVAERVALASSTSSLVNIARVNGSEASEEAALDLAVQMSRNDDNRFSWQDDIETCLSMSLEESYSKNNKLSQSSNEYVTKMSGDDNCKKSSACSEPSPQNDNLKGVKEESSKMEIFSSSSTSSSLLSHNGNDMNVDNNNDDNNAVSIAIQSDIVRIAVEESERDYIDSAMLSSIQGETQNIEEEEEEVMLRQVRLESLLESQAADARMIADTYGLDNEFKMSSILKSSAYEYDSLNSTFNGATAEAQGKGKGDGFEYNIETPSDVDLILKLSELSEEEALQLALRESAATSTPYSTAVRPNIYEYGSYGLRSPSSPYFESGVRGAQTGLAPVVLGPVQSATGDVQCQANIDSQGHKKTESETLQDAMRLYMKSVTSPAYPLSNPQNANINSTTTAISSSSSSSSSSYTVGINRGSVTNGDVLSSNGSMDANASAYGIGMIRTQAEEDEEEDEERELQRAIAESLK